MDSCCIVYDPCPLCGETGYDVEFGTELVSEDGIPFEVVKCRRCGLVRTSPRPTQAELARIYQDGYYAYEGCESLAGGQVKRALKTLALRCGAHAVYPYALRPPPPGHAPRILDVGCGSGTFLTLLADAHPEWERFGVELNAPAAAEAARSARAAVATGDFLSTTWPAETFAALCFWDVLEHLPSPRRVLENAYRLLQPGGVLYCLSPDYGSLWSRRFGPDWAYLLVPQHLYHFTAQTLTTLVETAGLKVLRVDRPRMRQCAEWTVERWLKHQPAPRFGRALVQGVKWLDCLRVLPTSKIYLAAAKP